MDAALVHPTTPRRRPDLLCSTTADQAAITDMTLARPTYVVGGIYTLPAEANNIELRFFAQEVGDDPENQISKFECYAWPKGDRDEAVNFKGPSVGQILFKTTVKWANGTMTKNPFTGEVENWAEADAYNALTPYRVAVPVGDAVNDIGQALSVDVRGLGYILVLCTDITVSTAVNEVHVLGRPF